MNSPMPRGIMTFTAKEQLGGCHSLQTQGVSPATVMQKTATWGEKSSLSTCSAPGVQPD